MKNVILELVLKWIGDIIDEYGHGDSWKIKFLEGFHEEAYISSNVWFP